MATRVLVLAAHGASPEEFESAFPSLGPGQRVVEAGWVAGTASLWCTDLDRIDPEALPGPVLMITTSDDEVWFLRVTGAGQAPFGIAFHHHLLDEDEREECQEPTFGLELLDLYEMVGPDCWPPPAVGELRDLEPAEAIPRFLEIQAEATADALARRGIEIDRQALIGVLTGSSLDEDCLESPTGSLAPFLRVIGLGSMVEWDEDEGDDEDDDHDDDDDDEPRQDEEGDLDDRARIILDRTAHLSPEPVAGGPVSLAAADLHHAFLLAWFCDEFTDPCLTVVVPEGSPEPQWPTNPAPTADGDDSASPGEIRIEPWQGGVRIGIARASVWRQQRWLRAIGACLGRLPDGTVATLRTSDTEPADEGSEARQQAGMQIYRGRIEAGVWWIDATSPALSADDLRAGLAFAGEADDDEAPIATESKAEGQAIVAAAKRSGMFSPLPTIGETGVLHSMKEPLMQLFFRRRFGEAWPTGASAAREQARREETDEIVENVLAGARERAGIEAVAPDDPSVLLVGEFSRYLRVDGKPEEARGLDAIGEAFDRQRIEQRNRFRVEILGEEASEPCQEEESEETVWQAMAALGFESLGGLTCEALPGVTLWGFARPEAFEYGSCLQSFFSDEIVEFFTAFDDGSSLTTTSNTRGEDLPHKAISMRSLPDEPPAGLLEAHRAEVERRRAGGATPLPAEPDLVSLARAIDAFLVKRMA